MCMHSGCGCSQYLPSQALRGPLGVAVSGSIHILGFNASFKSLCLPQCLHLADGVRGSSRQPFRIPRFTPNLAILNAFVGAT